MKNLSAQTLQVPQSRSPPRKPLLAHRYSAMTVNQPINVPVQQQTRQAPSRSFQVPAGKAILQQPRTTVPVQQQPPQRIIPEQRHAPQEHKTIDINLNINVNASNEKEFSINVNQPQQRQAVTSQNQLFQRKAPVTNVNIIPKVLSGQPVPVSMPVQPRQLSPSRGLRIPARIPSQQMVRPPIQQVAQPQLIQVVQQAPPPVIVSHSHISNNSNNSLIGTIPLNPAQQIQIQTDPCDQFEVKSDRWKLSAIHDTSASAQLITCVICQETFGVCDTSEHVRRHRRMDRQAPSVTIVSAVQAIREPQIRPIVEPQEFVMRPQENFYVVEKVAKGGRSSFTAVDVVPTSSALSYSTPHVVEVAKTEIKTQIIEIPDEVPSSIPGPAVMTSGVMIGGGEQPYIPPQPLDALEEMPSSLEETQHNRSRMNPHTVVIQAPPHPVIEEEAHIEVDHIQEIQESIAIHERGLAIHTDLINTSNGSGYRGPRVIESVQFNEEIPTAERQTMQTIWTTEPPSMIPLPPAPVPQTTRIVVQQDPLNHESKITITQTSNALFPQVSQQTFTTPAFIPAGPVIEQQMLNSTGSHRQGSIHNPVPSVSQSSIPNNSVQSSIARPGDIILPGTVNSVEHGSRFSGYRDPDAPMVTTVVKDTLDANGSVHREITEFVDVRTTPKPMEIPIQPVIVETITEQVIAQPEGSIDSRIRQIQTHQRRANNIPMTLVSPGLNLGLPANNFPVIHEQRLQTSGSNIASYPLQQKHNPYEYNFGRSSPPEQFHKKASRETQRMRVPKNLLAQWG